ncbi:MAG: hypothetical protein SCK28_09320 [Bacillota bacterium]|nr:hypothetical protein [Bacillota bacterium]
MDVFAMLVGLVLVVASGLMVGMPLIKNRDDSYDYYDPELYMEDKLEKRKEAVFSTLNEIEFDFRTNKLSEEDYQELQQKYKSQAVAILKAEEDIKTDYKKADIKSIEAEVEAEIEKEVEKILKKKKK